MIFVVADPQFVERDVVRLFAGGVSDDAYSASATVLDFAGNGIQWF